MAGEPVSYDVELLSTEDNSLRRENVRFPAPPHTILCIKKKVEEQFSIPVCAQRLSYEAHHCSDTTTVEQAGIRSGDTLLVKYSSQGDCQQVNEVVGWLREVWGHLNDADSYDSLQWNSKFNELLFVGDGKRYMENLAYTCFFPWLNPRKHVNKCHFVSSGGLEIMAKVYTMLHQQPWDKCIDQLKHMERRIIMVLWNLCETFDLRRSIVHCSGLDLCIKSLLRQKLESQDRTNQHSRQFNSWVLVQTIQGAAGLLCNLSELPECHDAIASNDECLRQLTCVILSPSYGVYIVQLIYTLFSRLANTTSTHCQLVKPLLIRRLLDVASRKEYSTSEDILMRRYYMQMFLAQVILSSPHLVPKEFHQTILDFMDTFLKMATYQAVREKEVQQQYVWSTFHPYIRPMYLPDLPQLASNENSRKLHVLSLRTILLSLQNMLGRADHREVLLKEGLEDYVVCMPTHVPLSLREQAKELVRIIGHIALQPPRLVHLAKAKLAKMHFGMQTIIQMPVREVIAALS